MTVDLKRAKPSEYQDAIIQRYHNSASALLEMIGQYKVNYELQNAIARIYESIFWFNTSIMNCSAQPVEHPEPVLASETVN